MTFNIFSGAKQATESKFIHQHSKEVWVIWVASLLTAAMGVVNIFSAVTPALAERFHLIATFLPLVVVRSGRLSAAVAGFALLLLAGNLLRRKRVAWLLTIIVLIISAVSHLIKGFDYEEATLAMILAVWLITAYSHFHAHSDQPSIFHGLKILLYALLFTLAYGVTGFYLLDRHFSVNFGFFAAIQQTIIMFTEFYDPGLQPITYFGRFFADSIYTVGAVTMGYAFLMLVRPVFIRHTATQTDREKAEMIVETYGRSALARFTLFDDKLYFFTPEGSMVAYVVKGRIALVLGDPIGPETEYLSTIRQFIAHCTKNDWKPAFYQTLPDNLNSYREAGLNAVCIGQEAIVNLTSFCLEGKIGKALRTPLNRLNRLEYHAEIFEPPLSEELIQQLRIVSDEWLTDVHGTEKRFSLGWFDEKYIFNSPVVVIFNKEGTITAFANLVPEYQRNEVAVDLMRRLKNTEPGTMEYLFVTMFQWAKAKGYDTFNLGLSALAGVGRDSKDPIVEKALHYIYQHIQQYYNFKGLHTFKSKFHPIWESRYLVYPGPANLPAVLTALVRADSGDDFLWEYLKS